MLALNLPLNSGSYLIEASAGTGKTWTIAALYIRLLLGHAEHPPVPIEKILVVTFSKAATAELKDRLRNRIVQALRSTDQKNSVSDPFISKILENTDLKLAKELLKKALWSFDHAPIYTIHGFCLKTLNDQAFSSKKSHKISLKNSPKILEEATYDFWRNYVQKHYFVAKICVNHRITPETLLKKIKMFVGQRHLIHDNPELKEISEEAWNLWKNHPERVSAMQNLLASRSKFKGNILKDHFWNIVQEMAQINFRTPRPDEEYIKYIEKLAPNTLSSLVKKGEFYNVPTVLSMINPCIDTLKGQIKQKDDFLLYAKQWIEQHAHSIRCQDESRGYHDLLQDLDDLIKEYPELAIRLQDQYQAILIDEFQDTDPTQWNIFSSLFGQGMHTLYFVGDPKQAIYGFRGADIFTYLRARRHCDSIFQLNENYRSCQALVDGLNALYNENSQAFVFDQICYNPVLCGRKTEDDADTLSKYLPKHHRAINHIYIKPKDPSEKNTVSMWRKYVASYCRSIISDILLNSLKRIQPKDITVLVQTHEQGLLIKNYLKEYGIPATTSDKQRIFDSPEAIGLDTLLYAWLLPEEQRISSVYISPLFLHQTTPEISTDIMHGYLIESQLWREQGISRAIQHFLDRNNLLALYYHDPNYERKLTNLFHLCERLQKASLEHHEPYQLWHWFHQRVLNSSKDEHDGEDYVLRLESESECINIMTIHASKGLQFPIVLCPFLWDMQEKHYPSIGKIHEDGHTKLVILNDQSKEQYQKEILAEHMRLLYVAVTRAEEALYIFHVDDDKHRHILEQWLGSSSLQENLKIKSQQHPHALSVWSYPSAHEPLSENQINTYSKMVKHNPRKIGKDYHRNITRQWQYTSFSQWAHLNTVQGKYTEEQDISTQSNLIEQALPSYAFPKGSLAGECIHDSLEELFTQKSPNISFIIEKNLVRYGFDLSWKQSLEEIIQQSINHPITQKNHGLIHHSGMICEMEFILPIHSHSLEQLRDAIITHPKLPKILCDSVHQLNKKTFSGFLRGFIDAFCQIDDEYYVLDYKSNHLGYSYEYYSENTILNSIAEHHYHIQLIIYGVAIRRYLQQRKVPIQKFAKCILLYVRAPKIWSLPFDEKDWNTFDLCFEKQ